MSEQTDANKAIVRRLVDEVFNGGDLDLIDELYSATLAPAARAWITPFRASFPDVQMDTVELIAEGDTVVGRFTCSATHTGKWLGHEPSGRRFTNIDEVNLYRFHNGRITDTWTLEDNLERLTQLRLPHTP
ncbi:ester cyclase [Kribbella sp. NBC_00889]|uniref:ester cyclase n=1 Tax=Kribbella sp. NBC_00889 TaxID=2975974 RepID=UPI00386C41FD|nr:ester cyclase [Kribbella sp. NBC_00889]